jgi:PHP family Zn ribbon phosphoesterase
MPFYADLHLHSRYARATSRNADLAELAWWARRKGITVLGAGISEVSTLVELRGFEPLTSAMRTQGTHLTTLPAAPCRTWLPQLKRGVA